MRSRYCHRCAAHVLHPIMYEGDCYCNNCALLWLGINSEEVDEEDTVKATAEATTGGEVRKSSDPYPYVIGEVVSIPLALQLRLLRESFYTSMLTLMELLDDDDFVADLEEMAATRLEQGYRTFGSTMYGWSEDTRHRNMMEELADYFVYASSR